MASTKLAFPDFCFHHFGLASKNPEFAATFFRSLGYETSDLVHDPLQKVDLIMCKHPSMPAVEIISPGGVEGPLDRMLAKHANGLIYHLCYITGDLERALSFMETDLGLRVMCLSEPKPAILFGGKAVSFYEVDGIGMVEIIDKAT
jgi:methylmalonyl-CoA/ethylmalonyl-CoA epimerase